MRFMDAANVDRYGIARVQHPKDPEHWLELDFSSHRFLPKPTHEDLANTKK